MQSMSDDDAAYTALLAQLLSDSSSTRNARVHSWIEHQYDFALSEHDATSASVGLCRSYPAPPSRSPSPSPSSSLGAHRTFSLDRPDSPLLPRFSADRPSSPHSDACPSYDTLFFPPSPNHDSSLPELDQLEERERERALRFVVQEMAHWKVHPSPSTPHKRTDSKPLPAPPPSPATSISHSTCSRALRSRSSSMRISRLPSFTSTLSSDQTQPQDVFTPPLPVSVIVHGEAHHELVFRHDHPYPDGYPLLKKDVYPHHEQDVRIFPPQDDKDSAFPSPTLSNFSCAYSRETSLITPYTSFPASPTSPTFAASCLPENVALPASPDAETFFPETDPVSSQGGVPLLPFHTVFPVSPASPTLPATTPTDDDHVSAQSQRLGMVIPRVQSESRWSIATTASLTPSAGQPRSGSFLSPRTPSKGKKPPQKESRTPRHRARFISFISRLSPGRSEHPAVNTGGGDHDVYDSGNDSGSEEVREKSKPAKALSKKSSLASLRASFSLSRASFSLQRPLISPTEEVPPLPMSPTRTSISPTRPSLPDTSTTKTETTAAAAPASGIPRVPSRANLLDSTLPTIPASASTVTSFRNLSQLSLVQSSISPAASTSKVSLLPSPTVTTASSQSSASGRSSGVPRISLLPPPSQRESFQSTRTLPAEPKSIHPLSRPSLASGTSSSMGKSLFRLKSKSKTAKPRTAPVPVPVPVPLPLPAQMQAVPPQSMSRSKLPLPGAAPPQPRPSQAQPALAGSSGPGMVTSGIPSPTTARFVPPSKLVSVGAPAPSSYSKSLPSPLVPRSKLPLSPSRIAPSSSVSKAPRTIVGMRIPALAVDVSVNGKAARLTEDGVVGTGALSKLPLASPQGQRLKVSTVRGFWRKQ